MADRLDVAERMSEGRLAVEHTESYVQACQVLGYRHCDLTACPTQIRDWYDSEDGLDLRVLDRDCAELRAAGAAVMEALWVQRAQVAELLAAWTGPGAEAAVRLLERHCDAGNTVATELRAAAQRCESLRDNLWYLVDAKVATAIAVDDRTQVQRQTWLAAAATVKSAAGDRESAEQIIRQQVIPYVDNDIRNDWLTTMRSTLDGVATCYEMVTDRMAAAPAACFEVPGDLGPGYQPLQAAPAITPQLAPAITPQPVATVTPAAAAVTPAGAAPSAPTDPAPAPTWSPATPAPDTLGAASGIPAGDLGGGLGGGEGLVGLASRIVDAFSGLLGSAADQLRTADPFGEDAVDENPFHADGKAHDEADGKAHDQADDKPDAPDEAKDIGDTDKPPADEPPPVSDALPPVEAPKPVDVPAPVEAPAPVTPAPAGAPPAANEASTPCEIAADQLPQAGQ
ncbi:MAG TPA: hypothetical protein VME67_08690 [Mycobacterium sp.]|nr:hypothetical protein [Mycobacterium sp.]HTX94912.1 hypothetical protein [Mycobacterium sp.]